MRLLYSLREKLSSYFSPRRNQLEVGFSMKHLPEYTGYDHHSTPEAFYDTLNKEFHFDFDPCPLNGEQVKDGLSCEWGMCSYVNPPYSNSTPWVEKAIVEAKKGKTVVMLLKADTSTRRFHDLILPNASEIRFVRGRLTFPPRNKPAPFASMIVVFKP